MVSSNREYLGRVAAVVTAVAEGNGAPSHVASPHQPIASFYSFGDTFVKYTLTTPEAEPAVEQLSSQGVYLYSHTG